MSRSQVVCMINTEGTNIGERGREREEQEQEQEQEQAARGLNRLGKREV